MKLFALNSGDIGEWGIYGIVDSLLLAEEWKARGDNNDYEEFELNKLPPVDRYRDNLIFPYAPDTSPVDSVSRKIVEYADYCILDNLLRGTAFGFGPNPAMNQK